MIAGGRLGRDSERKTAIVPISLTSDKPNLVLPSGGDSSYPAFAFYDGLLRLLYYSSTEENPAHTAICLAKVGVRKQQPAFGPASAATVIQLPELATFC